jgi:hypothetical protein
VIFELNTETLKMKFPVLPSVVLLSSLLVFSCGKIEKLPAEPSIRFNSFEVFDSTDILGNKVKGGRLGFYFEDGDGDLGLEAPQTSGQRDSTNLYLWLYRKTGGVYVKAASNDPLSPSNYRIPYLDRQGQNKILRGNITVTFLYLFYSKSDTIKYMFYLKDRASHSSDTVSTCEIVLTRNGSCSN